MAKRSSSTTPQPPVFHESSFDNAEREEKRLCDADKIKVLEFALENETKESRWWKRRYHNEKKYRILEKSVYKFKAEHTQQVVNGTLVLECCAECGLRLCPLSSEHTTEMTEAIEQIDEEYLLDLFDGWCPANFMLENGKYKCLPKW